LLFAAETKGGSTSLAMTIRQQVLAAPDRYDVPRGSFGNTNKGTALSCRKRSTAMVIQ
jgi:hypothetical protein